MKTSKITAIRTEVDTIHSGIQPPKNSDIRKPDPFTDDDDDDFDLSVDDEQDTLEELDIDEDEDF